MVESTIYEKRLKEMNFFYTGTLVVIPVFDIDLKISSFKEIVQEITFSFSLTLGDAQKLVKKINAFPVIELPSQKENVDTTIQLKIIAKEELCTILTTETIATTSKNPIDALFDYFALYKPLMFIDLKEYDLESWFVSEILKRSRGM